MKGQLYTLVRLEALTSSDSVNFLIHLVRHVGRLLVVWDGSPIHRGDVREFLASDTRGEIHVEVLPGYAPDLNPDEGVWQHLKNVEMRNLCCQDLHQLQWQLGFAIMRLRSKPHIIRSFFQGAGLPINA
jgi:transposase